MPHPLTDKQYQLQKFPGKGGWTYVAIPEIAPDKHAYFGLVRVSGSIDSYELKSCNLMPMGNGMLFLPVRAEIRKKIKKEAGNWVQLILYADAPPAQEVREELLLCLQDEPAAYHNFMNATQAQQQTFIDWIDATRTDDEKVQRIAQSIDQLLRGIQQLQDK